MEVKGIHTAGISGVPAITEKHRCMPRRFRNRMACSLVQHLRERDCKGRLNERLPISVLAHVDDLHRGQVGCLTCAQWAVWSAARWGERLDFQPATAPVRLAVGQDRAGKRRYLPGPSVPVTLATSGVRSPSSTARRAWAYLNCGFRAWYREPRMIIRSSWHSSTTISPAGRKA